MSFFLMMAMSLSGFILTGCHSGKKATKHDAEVAASVPVKVKGLNGREKKIVEESLTWLGTPYKYAGTDKGKGTDCSGLVMTVYQEAAGIKLPRNSRQQAEFCSQIKRKSVKAGDLVFFATGKDASKISHVGIMIDSNRFVHASSKKGVIVSEMNSPYYQRTFMMYGRVP